jgi:hypothetical protein
MPMSPAQMRRDIGIGAVSLSSSHSPSRNTRPVTGLTDTCKVYATNAIGNSASSAATASFVAT